MSIRLTAWASLVWAGCASTPMTADGSGGSILEPISLQDQRVSALHEAAHAVVCLAQDPDFDVYDVRVATALVDLRDTLGGLRYPRSAEPTTPEGRAALAATFLAGAEAEKILSGQQPDGCGQDLDRAERHCRPYCPENPGGACTGPGHGIMDDYRQTQACFQDAKLKAEALVRAHAEVIRSVADLIMGRPPQDDFRTVSGAELKEFLKNKGFLGQNQAK